MRKIFLAVVTLMLSLCSFAQTDSDSTKVYTFVEHMPEYRGGEAELMRFLQKNINYPEAERNLEIQGKVLVKFIVNETGIVEDVTVLKSVNPGLDNEAVRVIKMLAQFKPGQQQGKPVKVYYTVPIVFKLQDHDQLLMQDLADKMPGNELIKNGIAQYKSKNYKDAIKTFSKSVKQNNDALIYDMIAECYKKTGDEKNRCKALEKSAALGYKYAGEDLKKLCN